MVMSWIWTGIVLISILCALVLGNGSALAAATVSGAQAGRIFSASATPPRPWAFRRRSG